MRCKQASGGWCNQRLGSQKAEQWQLTLGLPAQLVHLLGACNERTCSHAQAAWLQSTM